MKNIIYFSYLECIITLLKNGKLASKFLNEKNKNKQIPNHK